MDVDGVEFIMANPVYGKLVKGYLGHQHCIALLSKQDPFPPLSAASLNDPQDCKSNSDIRRPDATPRATNELGMKLTVNACQYLCKLACLPGLGNVSSQQPRRTT